jgi:two-component system, sensor histidine kinase PdtaS
VERQGNEHIVLRVSDDGVGLPPSFDPQQSNGLGMRIVRAFADQLGAQVNAIDRGRGAEFVIVVPIT